jgi:Zn-dependent protease
MDNAAKHRISPTFGALVGVMLFGIWATWTETLPRYSIFIFVISAWVVSLCLHEYAHARTAYWAGDNSVVGRGYLTLDPVRYVHPGLSLLLPIAMVLLGGIGLPGGAVYINQGAIHDRRKQSLVSLAGPFANLVVALVCALPFLIAKQTMLDHPYFASGLAFFFRLQVIAVILNLLPIPGLDGFGAIEPHLPRSTIEAIAPYRGYVPFILFFVLSRGGTFADLLPNTADRAVRAATIPSDYAESGYYYIKFWKEYTNENIRTILQIISTARN